MMLSVLSTTPCVAPKLGVGRRRVVLCQAGQINPDIRKDEAKVVDTVDVSSQEKPQVAYCRCWRSAKDTFPLCDASHVKHNKETGDNVGPLLVKK